MRPKLQSFPFLIASAALYCFGYAQEMAQTTVAGAAFWLHVEYLGIPWSPGLWLLCARRHCGMRSPTALLFTIPVVAFVAQETNSLHHLYIRSMDMLPRGPFCRCCICTAGCFRGCISPI